MFTESTMSLEAPALANVATRALGNTAVVQRSGLDRLRGRHTALLGVMAGLLITSGEAVVVAPAFAQDAAGCVSSGISESSSSSSGTVTSSESSSASCSSGGPSTENPPVNPPAPKAPKQPTTPDTSKGDADSSHHPKKTKKPAARHHKPAEHNTTDPFNPLLGGLNMGDQRFTDGNGCFIATFTNAARVLTGDASLTAKRIYNQDKTVKDDTAKHPDIKMLWSPQTGVKNGADLFRALPAMAKRLGLGQRKAGAKGVTKALRKHRNYTAMVVFNPGHFAGPKGHYLRVAKVLRNGNWVLDDTNGKGKSGDSERASGWSPKALGQNGAARMRILWLEKIKKRR